MLWLRSMQAHPLGPAYSFPIIKDIGELHMLLLLLATTGDVAGVKGFLS